MFTSALIVVKHMLCPPWDTPKCSSIAPYTPAFPDSLDAVLEEADAPLLFTLRVALNSRRVQCSCFKSSTYVNDPLTYANEALYRFLFET